MGSTGGRESCGRCGLSTVVDAVEDEKEDEAEKHDPFEGEYIELTERELMIASAPAVAAGRVKRWLDETADRLIYGR